MVQWLRELAASSEDPVLLLAATWELTTVLRVSGDPLTSSGLHGYQACI